MNGRVAQRRTRRATNPHTRCDSIYIASASRETLWRALCVALGRNILRSHQCARTQTRGFIVFNFLYTAICLYKQNPNTHTIPRSLPPEIYVYFVTVCVCLCITYTFARKSLTTGVLRVHLFTWRGTSRMYLTKWQELRSYLLWSRVWNEICSSPTTTSIAHMYLLFGRRVYIRRAQLLGQREKERHQSHHI